MNERKIKGSVVELKVQTSFIELGYNVSTPYGDCEKYDFIADIEGKFYRIQCKTATTDDGGKSISLDLRRSDHRKKIRSWHATYQDGEVDFFATHFNGKTYLLPAEECNTRRILRFADPPKGHEWGVRYARDYEIAKVIGQLLEEND